MRRRELLFLGFLQESAMGELSVLLGEWERKQTLGLFGSSPGVNLSGPNLACDVFG